jgi:hypothetical protein
MTAFFADASCVYGAGGALVSVQPSTDKFDTGVVGINGYKGAISATRTLSADHRAITVRASAPVLANRPYSCVHKAGEPSYRCLAFRKALRSQRQRPTRLITQRRGRPHVKAG